MSNAPDKAERPAGVSFSSNITPRIVKKDKLASLFSALPNMAPETALRAVEQFPAAMGNATSSTKDMLDTIPAFLEDESKMIDMLLDDNRRCWERINDPSIDSSERDACYRVLAANKNHARAECAEKRKFKIELFDHVSTVLLVAIGAPLAILGVAGKLPAPSIRQ